MRKGPVCSKVLLRAATEQTSASVNSKDRPATRRKGGQSPEYKQQSWRMALVILLLLPMPLAIRMQVMALAKQLEQLELFKVES